ncbi:cytochrome c oxidase assembly factor 1 family protein [Mesorhizobium sp. ZC-5]|uniref:cytochrome c oxidase assembly factor 1 family protein n=1 Tax=Mesorhizobium sp. ZC-5 TaxID=2986066 RepID=UPI0021E99B67|nr:cytochrome c oxidase assembly factor 1 family protein [Mesorhizobium sp. ZC-5]MCV3240880.1 cytochrome c oxidase assembly factor 1 family protein [Mesorhizobium sp. ZC-5]
MADQPLNNPAEIPADLDRWNWGAFLLNWIWGIGNSVFIALLMFVPLVNIVMIFVLGARGSRWAWRNRAWRDAEHFRSVQRKWAIAGIIVWAGALLLAVGLTFGVMSALKNSLTYALTMQEVRSSATAKAALGDNIEAGFWVNGNISIDIDGSGDAQLSIPLSGSKGSGRVVSRGVRTNGIWDLRLVLLQVDGSDTPLVLKNKDNLAIPSGSLGI